MVQSEPRIELLTWPRPPLDGWQVRRCYIDSRFGLVLAASERGDADKALVSFNANVRLIAGSDSQVFDVAGPKEGLGRLLGRYGMTISTLTVSDDGTLVIAFEDGWTLRCDPDPSYVAWELRAGGEWIVCRPGGGILPRVQAPESWWPPLPS